MQGAVQPGGQEVRPGLVSKPRREAGCRGAHAVPEGAPATRETSSSKEEQRAELRDTSHPAVSPCGGPGTLAERWAKPKDEGRRAVRPGPRSLAEQSPRWDRQSGGTGCTQAVPQRSCGPGHRKGFRSGLQAVLCLLNILWVFHCLRKSLFHTQHSGLSQHTPPQTQTHRSSPPAPRSPGLPAPRHAALRAQHLRAQTCRLTAGRGLPPQARQLT